MNDKIAADNKKNIAILEGKASDELIKRCIELGPLTSTEKYTILKKEGLLTNNSGKTASLCYFQKFVHANQEIKDACDPYPQVRENLLNYLEACGGEIFMKLGDIWRIVSDIEYKRQVSAHFGIMLKRMNEEGVIVLGTRKHRHPVNIKLS